MLMIYTTVGRRLCQQLKNRKNTYQHLKGPSVAVIALHPYQNSQNNLNFAINNGISSSASLLSFFEPSRANLSSNHSNQPIYKKYTFSKTWPYLRKEPLRDRVLSKRPDMPSSEDTARLWKYYIKVRTFYSAWARTGVMLVCIVATTSISMSITQMRDYLLKVCLAWITTLSINTQYIWMGPFNRACIWHANANISIHASTCLCSKSECAYIATNRACIYIAT